MKNNLIFFVLLISGLAFSQKNPREILNGQVISDSLQTDNITVKNLSTNTGTITDSKGNFSIYARATDTLFFTSLSFRDVKLILNESHFTVEKIVVKLDTDVNVMEELVMTNLTGNLAADSKRVKIKNYTPSFNSGEIIRKMNNEIRPPKESDLPNTALPQNMSSLTGVNFKKLYQQLAKPKPKKYNPPVKDVTPKTFQYIVRQRYAVEFFTESLSIPADEIGLFLSYCDRDSETEGLLHHSRQLELTDYLVSKSAEYLKKDK